MNPYLIGGGICVIAATVGIVYLYKLVTSNKKTQQEADDQRARADDNESALRATVAARKVEQDATAAAQKAKDDAKNAAADDWR